MNKKSCILILGLCIFAKTSSAQININADSLCKGIYSDYTCAKVIENTCLIKDSSLIHRSGDTLIFNYKCKNSFRLLDIYDGEEDINSVKFCYRDFIDSINCYLIYVQYYEGSKFLLINANTKKSATLISSPFFSNDKKYFAVFNFGLGDMDSRQIIEIWKVSSEDFLRVYRKSDFTSKSPCEVRWNANNDLEVDLCELIEKEPWFQLSETITLINNTWVVK